jgi:hypothetical protein
MSRRASAAFWWAVLPAMLSGCAFTHARQPVPLPDDGGWPLERDRYTRTTKVYDRFDDIAFATATYQAPSVRALRVERITVWRGLTDQERDAQLTQEKTEQERYEDFLLSFYTGDRAANDLDSQKSVWRVALEVHGDGAVQELEPASIEQVRVDATLNQLYPYIGHFDTVYRLHFPPWTGPKPLADIPFVLRIAGALGKVELRFDEPPEE